MQVEEAGAAALGYDVFTELDPLGTGRSKPYVDKKLFFQELKNPPKKVLKDLVPTTQSVVETSSKLSDRYGPTTTMTSLSRHSGGSVAIARGTPAPTFTVRDAFATDPFDSVDPFDDADPFEDSFKEDPFTNPAVAVAAVPDLKLTHSRGERKPTQIDKEPASAAPTVPTAPRDVFNGPLQVTLPPEPAPKSPRLQRQVIICN